MNVMGPVYTMIDGMITTTHSNHYKVLGWTLMFGMLKTMKIFFQVPLKAPSIPIASQFYELRQSLYLFSLLLVGKGSSPNCASNIKQI